MKLNVSVDYKTNWGEQLVLCFAGKKYPLSYFSGGLWMGEFDNVEVEAAEYSYEVVRDGATIRKEWRTHRLEVPAGAAAVTVVDRWMDRPNEAPFYSAAFTDAIFGRKKQTKKAVAKTANVQFRVPMPVLRPNEILCLAGSSKALGNWEKLVAFSDAEFPEMVVNLKVTEPFAFKFVIADKETMTPIAWETIENRYFTEVPAKGAFVVEYDYIPVFEGRNWKGAGTAIPVFSIRTEDDFGVGEFLDLKKMVDWAASTGQGILQLLPINDTTMFGTWEDSYPYNANSTFALHPQFVNLPAAGVPANKEYNALQAELNSLEKIDYERVNQTKTALMRKAFQKTFAKLSVKKDYVEFIQKNNEWLLPYAAFCTLRDLKGTPDFSKWGTYKTYSKTKIAKFVAEHQEDVDFHCFVQYHLDKQLSEVCAYAHSKGVVLKGDLPIGISRTSVDAWLYPELFHMDSQAGAPPDAFSATGQNWGFPTYNWEKMSEDGYAWWKARFAKMSEYFDVFRIDHILGFFRIWEIPMGAQSGLDGYFNPALPYSAHELQNMGFDVNDKGLFIEDPRKKGHYHPRIGAHNEGYQYLDGGRKQTFDNLYTDFFYRRHNQFWKETALKKLPELLDSTGMLACGEDLGMIPATVPEVMDELKILSLEIQRMPKSIEETFAHPANYPYLSVCTTSTHDMNPIRAWWEEDRAMTEQFFAEMLQDGNPVPSFCEPWVAKKILEQHMYSPAMLTILPLQDWLAMDGELRLQGEKWVECDGERINVPANSRHYWRYRMHLSVEQLIASENFNNAVRDMIVNSGRK
jgi:4-alpha-glucanotransferase